MRLTAITARGMSLQRSVTQEAADFSLLVSTPATIHPACTGP